MSAWDNALEEQSGRYRAVRLGFRHVKGLREGDMAILTERRGKGYGDIVSLWSAGVPQAALELLADADAFRSIGLDRRKALWEVTALSDRPAALFTGQINEAILEPSVRLPVMSLGEHVVNDYASMSLSLKAHPVSFVRDKLTSLKITSAAGLKDIRDGHPVKVAGLVLIRQRPGTAGGVCFMTIEDETGVANLVIFESLFGAFRREILHSKLMMAEGKLQREGEVVHIIAKKCHDLTPLLRTLTKDPVDDLPLLTLSRADERTPQGFSAQNKRTQVRFDAGEQAIPGARNFH